MVESITLYELTNYIKQVFALNFQDGLWIRTEIAQCRQSKGHYYLELIEKSEDSDQIIAQMSAVIWAGDFASLKRKIGDQIYDLIKAGSEVQVMAEVSFHDRYGLKLMIRDIDINYTLGKLELQRREILQRLQKENLLNLNSKIKLPTALQRIAVISSPTAAGYKDFMHQLVHNEYGYDFHLQLFPARMQGQAVSREIRDQLSKIHEDRYDCIVIIRGGGSRIDLSDFDEYDLARSIAICQLPVITGIGHEIDTSIADMVAHTALKTPTAVAEFLINRMLSLEHELSDLADRMKSIVIRKINTERMLLVQHESRVSKLFYIFHQRELAKLDTYLEKIKLHLKQLFEMKKQKIEALSDQLKLLDYREVMKRGYAITTKGNTIINSVKDIQLGDQVKIVYHDGNISTEVKSIKNVKK